MARRPSAKSPFGLVTNALLARWSEERNLFGDLGYSVFKQTRPDAMFAVWRDLP